MFVVQFPFLIVTFTINIGRLVTSCADLVPLCLGIAPGWFILRRQILGQFTLLNLLLLFAGAQPV